MYVSTVGHFWKEKMKKQKKYKNKKENKCVYRLLWALLERQNEKTQKYKNTKHAVTVQSSMITRIYKHVQCCRPSEKV